MSRSAIVDAAIAIADEHGLAAVSMGAVAKRLGFTSMSIYRYVSSKEDLLTFMVDAAYGVPPESIRQTASWKDTCRIWSREMRNRYHVHPWTLDVPIGGPPMTPNQLLWLEYFLQGFESGGLGDHEALSCALLITGYASSNAKLERNVSRISSPMTESLADQYQLLVEMLRERGTYPKVSNVIANGLFEDDEQDNEFEFGLERIIEGIEMLISRKHG